MWIGRDERQAGAVGYAVCSEGEEVAEVKTEAENVDKYGPRKRLFYMDGP